MLKNITETISNLTKITATVLQLAVLGVLIGGGYLAYSKISAFLSKPIPDISVPSFNFGQKPQIDESLWHYEDTGEYAFPDDTPMPPPR